MAGPGQVTPRISWPDGKQFAFSVFDDTDLSAPGNFEAVYDLLGSLGMRTTKSVWAATGPDLQQRSAHGSTCDDADYLRTVLRLQQSGFEIAYHNSYYEGLPRARIEEAFERFKMLFGSYPQAAANHAESSEGIYWGYDRLTGLVRSLYRVILRRFGANPHQGHIPQSPYFWGDLCQQHVHYVRNFVFGDINTLAACPFMPYYDPLRPYVQAWFAASNGQILPDCWKLLTERNQDRLEASGGACILYTHFGSGFQQGHTVEQRFAQLIRRIAGKNGWFVPVSTLLDHIRSQRGVVTLTSAQRQRLEWRWFAHKLVAGST
jgi:hypothetical protein